MKCLAKTNIVTMNAAITLLNAIGTDHGSAIGIKAHNHVILRQSDDLLINTTPEVKPDLINSCIREFNSYYNNITGNSIDSINYEINTESNFPPSRGMKTSSIISNAIISALFSNYDRELPNSKIEKDIVTLAARASVKAGVSITGAFDDAYASLLGGIVITENRTGDLVLHNNIPEDLMQLAVVLLIPNDKNPKSIIEEKIKNIDAEQLNLAYHKILEGNYLEAVRLNTEAYGPLLGNMEIINDLSSKSTVTGLNGAGPSLFSIINKRKINDFIYYLGNNFPEMTPVQTEFNDRSK